MRELKIWSLNDPGKPHDGTDVVLCRAEREGVFKYTCVRADNTIPPGGIFSANHSTLPDLDVTTQAWVFRTAEPLGYITQEERLKMLLGQSITVCGWTITPL